MNKMIVAKGLRFGSKPKAVESLVIRNGRIVEAESGRGTAVKDGEGVSVTFSDGKTVRYEIEALPPLILRA